VNRSFPLLYRFFAAPLQQEAFEGPLALDHLGEAPARAAHHRDSGREEGVEERPKFRVHGLFPSLAEGPP
jgi:hypothetical protein